MFTQLVTALLSTLNQNLDGWKVITFKFWINNEGVEYAEARVAVFDDVIRFRVKGQDNSIRLVDVELQKPQLRGRKSVSHGNEEFEGS